MTESLQSGQTRMGFLMGKGNPHVDRDVITSNNVLATDGRDLNLDVYYFERLRTNVYFHKAWVGRFVELSEARNKTNRA